MNKLLASLIAAFAIGGLAVNAQDAPKPVDPPKAAEKADEKPAPTVADAPEGKFKPVTVNDLKLTDEARKKEIALLVIAPDGEGKFPLILFSSNQAPAQVGPLANYWASHGYVVIAPTHADTVNTGGNRDMGAFVDRMFDSADADKDGKLSSEEIPETWKERLAEADADKDGFLTKPEVRKALGIPEPAAPEPKKEEGKPEPEKKPDPKKEEEFSFADEPAPPAPRQPQGRQGQGRQGQNRGNRQTLQAAQERVKDFALLLDSLDKLAEKSSALKGKIDKDKIVIAGHGFGAYTAGLLAGATVDVSEEAKAQSFADKRIKAVIEISPAGSGLLGLGKESWKGIKMPMLTITGSADRQGGGRRGGDEGNVRGPEWRREAFANAPEGGKVHVLLEGGSAFNFLGAALGMPAPRGREDMAETNKNVYQWVQATTLLFMDANLKGSEAAGKSLDAEAFKKATDGKVTLEKK